MTSSAVAERLQPRPGYSGKDHYGALKKAAVAATALEAGGRRWSHAALLYRTKFEVRLFEMHDHKDVRDDKARPDFVWIEPRIPPERLQLVVERARLVLRCHKTRKVPYGFGYRTSSFDERGGMRLGEGEIGFTCSTIIAALFESERLPLIDPTSWPPPDSEDTEARVAYLEHVRKKDPEHATLLAKDLKAPRISPEEVVAGAALHPTVGTFDTVQDGAGDVRARLKK